MIIAWRPFVQKALERESKIKLKIGTTVKTTIFIPEHIGGQISGFVDTPDLYNDLSIRNRTNLPLYPDVTIHYRCSDNIFFDNMGLLPFHHIVNVIPSQAEFIFIVTEGSNPQDYQHVRSVCKPVLQALADKIKLKFPKANVVIRSGGRHHDALFELFDMFVYSSVVITSASSFSTYMALSNSNGKVFLPYRRFMGHFNLTCYGSVGSCGNVHTLHDGFPINFWIRNDGTKLSERTITSQDMIDILENKTYFRAHRPHEYKLN
jgi:hypothetical protein